jgi:hypothetical protein
MFSSFGMFSCVKVVSMWKLQHYCLLHITYNKLLTFKCSLLSEVMRLNTYICNGNKFSF